MIANYDGFQEDIDSNSHGHKKGGPELHLHSKKNCYDHFYHLCNLALTSYNLVEY